VNKKYSFYYLGIIEFFPFGCYEVKDPRTGPWQSDPSDQQDDQHHIRERGSEIHHLKNKKNSE